MTEEGVRVVPVSGRSRRFLTFPWKVYGEDPLWIPPLLPETRKRFSPSRGALAGRGPIAAFLAYRGRQRVGRIAVAEDRPRNARSGRSDCTIGFFDSIDDESVARAVFDAAEGWARERGLTNLYGPFQFDYEDSYGLLVSGRDRPPTLLCGHTPAYYVRLFESAGFEPARPANIAIEVPVTGNEKRLRWLAELGRRAREAPTRTAVGHEHRAGQGSARTRDGSAVARRRIVIREADFGDVEGEIDRLHLLLNRALTHLADSVPWERSSVYELIEGVKRSADPRYVLFLEVDGETVGWFAAVPNVNEILAHGNGLRYPWDYLRLFAHRNDQPRCLAAKSILVLPSQWHSRSTIALLGEMARRILDSPYRWVDLSLTSEDNPETPRIAAQVGGRVYKRYQVYARPVG